MFLSISGQSFQSYHRLNEKTLSSNLQTGTTELNRLKESYETNLTLVGQRDNDLRSSQQMISRLKSEVDILKLREEDGRFMTEQLQGQLNQSYGQLKELNEQKNMAEAALTQISSGSETIIQERNRLLEQINELQVRYEQNRSQLEEVSNERDYLQVQNKATVVKVQHAMDEMNSRLEESQGQNSSMVEELDQWRNSGKPRVIST